MFDQQIRQHTLLPLYEKVKNHLSKQQIKVVYDSVWEPIYMSIADINFRSRFAFNKELINYDN